MRTTTFDVKPVGIQLEDGLEIQVQYITDQ